jgi:CRP/FNR family transcriptional regulator, cyclic AMP receptor protein
VASVLDRLAPNIADAWRDSCFGNLPSASTQRLLHGARTARVQSGENVYCAATVALVVDGLLRLYARAPDGRQVTLRFAPAGAVIGIAPALAGGPGDATHGEALRESVMLKLVPSGVHAAACSDAGVAQALALDLAEQLTEARQRLLDELCLPVRSRVAAHLLNVAERDGRWMVVCSSHQRIAASIGSVREVVSRTLKQMEREGLVDRIGGASGHLRLIDPAALHALWAQPVRDEGASSPSARALSTASARVCTPSFA